MSLPTQRSGTRGCLGGRPGNTEKKLFGALGESALNPLLQCCSPKTCPELTQSFREKFCTSCLSSENNTTSDVLPEV